MPFKSRAQARLVSVLALVGTIGLAVAPVATQANVEGEPAGSRPNLVVFMTDDQRNADTLDVMPQTMRYFGAEGTVFPNGFASTPLCCPSRSATFSGRYTHNHKNLNNQTTGNLDHSATFQSYLQAAGYQTGMIGKFLLDWSNGDPPPHFDYWALMKGGYIDVPWGTDEGSLRSAYATHETTRQALRILDKFERNDDKPFVLYIAPQAPHAPWEPESQYAKADVGSWAGNPAVFETDRSDKPSWVRSSNWTRDESAPIHDNMRRTLKSVDDMVASVMRRLDELGEGSNTMSIYTSDNAYQWGEHGLTSKYHPYSNSINVPFMVRWPGRVPTRRVDRRLVSNVDITPSLLAVAGVTPQLKYPLDGIPFLDSSGLASETRAEAYLEYFRDEHRSIPDWSSIRTEEMQYIEYRDAGALVFREYYDLVADPHQLVNLLKDGNAGNDPDTTALSDRLAVYRKCSGATGTLPCVQNAPPPAPYRGIARTATGNGYWLPAQDGRVLPFGDAKNFGDASSLPLNHRVLGMTATPGGAGYWLVAADGGIFSFGDAKFYGSTGNLTLNKPIVAMAATPTGGGYWMVATDGGIFSFGDAKFYGSTGSIALNKPIVAMAPTPSGRGYWLVASDGGIFAFGDAKFFGSTGSIALNKPIVSMAPTPDGAGYLLMATDGGLFSFGTAQYYGSTGAAPPPAPGTQMATIPSGAGYWLAFANGQVFAFGDAKFYGSAG
jgi:arylsulfatase A-like enzyme